MPAKYDFEFDMKYTDNPYIDLIVNCVKILGMNAVVKNENQALHYEDVRSATLAAKYIKFKEGTWNYERDGEYTEDSYMEWNSYYRMLNGLPPAYTLNDEEAYFEMTGYKRDIYVDIGNAFVIPDLYYKYFIDVGEYDDRFEGRYLHELNNQELSIISVNGGALDQIKADYCNDDHYQYIYHLGNKRIDFHTARTAVNFSLLYLPVLKEFEISENNGIIENKFRRMYDRNRKYTMSTVYSEAYRFMSYHYDAFIQILIIIQTMVDMISEVQEYIINKDVFDSRTIRYLFESYGIAYYKEIPVTYQIRIIKNVNTLLKYKSSHRNIMDILELFDDDTIIVYTYYLMKTKQLHRDDFHYYTMDDVNPKYINDKCTYYVGRIEDVSNNKVPVMSVPVNEDDTYVTYDKDTKKMIKDNFIRQYLYNYILANPNEEDHRFSRRLITEDLYQPIASKYSESLLSLTDDKVTNGSFILDFLNSATTYNDIPWFGTQTYNVDPNNPYSKEYMKARNVYLTNLKVALANVIRITLKEETDADDTFALNQYNFRKIKYRLYGLLGIFKYDNTIDFDNTSDAELASRFYTSDQLLDEEYCLNNGISEVMMNEFLESEDRYILNHSIPFMTWFGYKDRRNRMTQYDNKDVYLSNDSLYVFGTSASFGATQDNLADNYYKFTKRFRENFIVFARVFVEAVFDKFAYDPINNPTPRYEGWMDIYQVVNKTGKSLDELKLGDTIDILENENLPIYNSAFVYEVVTEDMIGTEYFRKNYDLCFLKVPILDPNAYSVIERKDLRRNYDAITLADPFWDGVSTFDILTDEERDKLHQSKRQQILNKEFTIERTKYIAVEANIDLVKMSYQVSYFMNMLYDKHRDEEGLMVEVDSEISSDKVRLNDLMTFAIALNFIYNGTEPDNIASDMEKNMYINGFNFDTDWTDIYNYLENRHFINHNYDNEIHEYTYTNEFGETITNVGYGMSPTEKGWLTEMYDDFVNYGDIYYLPEDKTITVLEYFGDPNYGPSRYLDYDKSAIPTGEQLKIGAFLSGRYEQCSDVCGTSTEMEMNFGSSDIWNYNLKHHPKVDDVGNVTVFNIAWEPTQYPDADNNSHGLWLDTEILTTLEDENISDLEKINMLKKIYYSNTNLYNHLTYMLRHAESKRMYDIYKILFDSFMETKMNHDYYGQIDKNGNIIYTNKNNTDQLFYITLSQTVESDEEGFPYFIGEDLGTGEKKIYKFVHNSDYSVCYYCDATIPNPSKDVVEGYECFYNMVDKRDGSKVKEYIVHKDEQNQLPRDTYFFPESAGHFFTFNISERNYLVFGDNPDIRIPIDIDEDGEIVLPTGVKYIFYTDENGELAMKEVPIDYHPVGGEQEIIIIKKIAESYYDFLQYRNPDLYAHLVDLKYNYNNVPVTVDDSSSVVRYMPSDDKRRRIETLCELIAASLENYFDKKEWRALFNLIPTANIYNIQSYIMKVIVFFKSWKTQILDTTVNYLIDDPYNNHVHIIDDMYYNTTFDNLLEKVRPKDFTYFENHVHYKDPVKIGEKVDIEDEYFEPYKIDFGFGEKIYGQNFDFPSLTSKLIFKDKIGPGEKVEFTPIFFNGEPQIDSKGNILLP